MAFFKIQIDDNESEQIRIVLCTGCGLRPDQEEKIYKLTGIREKVYDAVFHASRALRILNEKAKEMYGT